MPALRSHHVSTTGPYASGGLFRRNPSGINQCMERSYSMAANTLVSSTPRSSFMATSSLRDMRAKCQRNIIVSASHVW